MHSQQQGNNGVSTIKKDNTPILAIDTFCSLSCSANIILHHEMNEILWVKQGNSWAGRAYKILHQRPSTLLYCDFSSDHLGVKCFYIVIVTSGRLTHLCTQSTHGEYSITSTLRYKHQFKMLVQIR